MFFYYFVYNMDMIMLWNKMSFKKVKAKSVINFNYNIIVSKELFDLILFRHNSF